MAGKRPKQFWSGGNSIISYAQSLEQCEAIQEIIVVLLRRKLPGFFLSRQTWSTKLKA